MTMVFVISTNKHEPLYLRVANALNKAIDEGRLKPGDRLPAVRELADSLCISRATVLKSIRHLRQKGVFETKPGFRIYIAGGAPQAQPRFKGGDQRTWRSIARQFPSDFKNDDETPESSGSLRLRTAYANYLSRSRGMLCHADQVMVFRTREARLHLIADVLLRDSTMIAVEDPCFPAARTLFRSRGAQIVHIPVDYGGLNVDQLRASDDNIRLVYVTPSHQRPTGVVMSPGRRQQLIDWARRQDAIILEDDYDCEFRYEARILPALAGVEPQRVIHISCLEKILGPLTTLAFLVVPSTLIETFRQAKKLRGSRIPSREQWVLAEFIERGYLENEIRKNRKVYRTRRNAAVEAFKKHFGETALLAPECGGTDLLFSLRVDKPEDFVLDAGNRTGLAITSSSHYYAGIAPANEFVVAFAELAEEAVDDCFARFAQEVLA